MKQKLINNILQGMLGTLNNAQMKRLQLVLETALDRYFESDDIQDTSQMAEANKKMLDAFIDAKRIEGCSEKSLRYYKNTIDKMLV